MRLKLTSIALLFSFALMLLVPSYAMAHDRGRGKGRKHNGRVVYRYEDGWRYYLIGDRYYGPYREGWYNGRKVGWRGCDLPPGLAKKYGCRGRYIRTYRYYRGYPVVSIPLDSAGRFRPEFRGGY
jgi:hypothetical protein